MNNGSTVPLQTPAPKTLPDLSARDTARLVEERAISPSVILARGYRTLADPDEIGGRGFSKVQARLAPALCLPLWDVHGEQYLCQIRPESPRTIKDKGEERPAKYECPTGSTVRLDVHPACREALGDPTVSLWLTEGVPKGDSLLSAGAGCVIAFPTGVWGWKGTNAHGGKVILPCWDRVALNGRIVNVVYDSDIATKKNVKAAMAGLYAFLRSGGAVPCLVRWPEAYTDKKWGCDDFLASGKTLADLQAMIPPVGLLPATPPRGNPAAPGLRFNCTPSDRPRPLLSNILEVLEHDTRWEGILGFDELAQTVMLLKSPPCQPADVWQTRALQESDHSEAANWLQRQYDLCTATALVAEALATYAQRFPFHPVRTYLAGLTWDGTPRLDTWLVHYCRAADTPYTRAVGSKALIAAVARVQQPGCKVDTVCVLEGQQGIGKSTVWRTLAKEDAWFTDSLPNLHDKDAAQSLRGVWFVELGELAALHRSEVEAVKRFISSAHDHYRPSYARLACTIPRHNVFVGSTNREAYLKDETGNRRFWPVACAGVCDVEALERDRDQLWAEALERYRTGEAWHLTPALEIVAEQEQAARVEADDWEAPILDFITSPVITNAGYVTTKRILEEVFHLDSPKDWTQANTKRIGGILRRHQWHAGTVRPGDGTVVKAFKTPSVTGYTTENQTTGYAESPNKDAVVTGVTDVTCFLVDTREIQQRKDDIHDISPNTRKSSIAYKENAVTPVTGVTSLNNKALNVTGPDVQPVTASQPCALGAEPPCPHLRLDTQAKCKDCGRFPYPRHTEVQR